MAEKPILFSGPMVRALLDGRKTQTRRIVKVPFDVMGERADGSRWPWREDVNRPGFDYWYPCPYGAPGDTLWVRETFSTHVRIAPEDTYFLAPDYHDSAMGVHYWADGNPENGDWTRPKPSIHMPRWASRLTLEIVNVRVERVQDITTEDARAEGVESEEYWQSVEEAETIALPPGTTNLPSPRNEFRNIWERINGADSWDANPWVWVLTFRSPGAQP